MLFRKTKVLYSCSDLPKGTHIRGCRFLKKVKKSKISTSISIGKRIDRIVIVFIQWELATSLYQREKRFNIGRKSSKIRIKTQGK
jgi:hypothetical protein